MVQGNEVLGGPVSLSDRAPAFWYKQETIMADEPTATAAPEPAESPTPETAPGAGTGDESSTGAAQPSYEELKAYADRLKSSLSGSRSEWERERQERERIQSERDMLYRQMQSMQPPQAQVPQPAQRNPEYRRMAEEFYQSVIEGDKDKAATIFEDVVQRPITVMGQAMQQAAQIQTKQQGFVAYLAKRGISPGTETYNEAMKRMNGAQQNPDYSWASSPTELMSAVVGDLLVERAGSMGAAKESARKQSVDGAFTEGTKNPAPPGKSSTAGPEKMYFTGDELRVIRHMQREDGLSEEAARKKYWDHMDPRTRASRKEAGRAV